MRADIFTLLILGLLPLAIIRPYFGILFYFWFSLMNPHRLMYATALPFAEIIAVAAVLGWLYSSEPKHLVLDRTSILLIIWLGWTGVTTYFSINPYGLDGAISKFVLFSKIIGFSLLAYCATTTRRRVEALFMILVLSIGYFGLKGGVWAILSGGSARVYGPDDSFIADNNDLGTALVMILPLMTYLRSIHVHKLARFGFLFLQVCTVIAVFFTYSRAAFLAMLGIGLYFVLKARNKFLYLAFAAVAVVAMFQFAPQQWFERMRSIETYQSDESAESRLYLWRVSLAVAEARPIVGGGFRDLFNPQAADPYARAAGLPELARARAPHSIYFEALGEHGFPGLAIFLTILFCTWLDARFLARRAKTDPRYAWAGPLGRMAQVGLAGFCIAGAFGTLVTYDGLYVLVIACAAARRVVLAEAKTVTEAERSAGPTRVPIRSAR